MYHEELRSTELLWLFERPHVGQLRVDGLQKICVGTSRLQHELLVEELEDGWGSRLFNHGDGGLVVLEGDALPLNTLLLVLLLLEGEHVLIKLLLQLLVGVVDAELFEGVLREDLEAEDVEQADKSQLVLLTFPVRLCLFSCVLHRDGRVDLLYDPAEDRSVKVLDKGVTSLVGLINCQRAVDHLATQNLSLRRKRVHQLGEVDAEKAGRCRDVVT